MITYDLKIVKLQARTGIMAVESVSTLIDMLRKARLLDLEKLDETVRFLQPRFNDPRALAKELVRRGWLTVYQVNQLFQGQIHELAFGPFRILDKLGEGGVSQVFKAWHTGSNGVVALKVIREELLTNPEVFGRFQREMKVVAHLDHPNIVKAIDLEVAGHANFFAMEYVEGTDLGKLVQLSGPLAAETAADYIHQAALGLQHAHEHGLVHRDIKPANLLLTGNGATIKILDMGLARLRLPVGEQAQSATLTLEGMVIGTPDYLAPEQAKDARKVDIRADVYSLGCTFYYLLTGQPPFPGGSGLLKLYKHHREEATAVESLRPDVPGAVSVIIKKMLAKKPEDRYQIPADVATALGPYRR